jgi:hypothetical protein
MIARLQMSDLHLGDPRSVFSNPKIASVVVDNIGRASDGTIEKLILAGDVWEECVPGNIGAKTDGVADSVAVASRNFFGELFKCVNVAEVVIVPGNHDLSTWHWYAENVLKISTVTSYDGVEVDPAAWPWLHLLPGLKAKLRFAYPLYWDKSAGPDYPMLVVTHGHLLDSLVLGQEPEATYAGLKALGCERSTVSSAQISVGQVAGATLKFCLSLWARYSERDFIYFNKIMRRLDHPISCSMSQLFDHRSGYFTMDHALCESDQSPTAQGHADHLPWFCELLVADPYLPTPVGSLRQGPVGPAFEKSSCLTFGHDHLGLHKQLVVCGVPFAAVDSGGWTSEYEGHLPHSHVLVWDKVTDIVPVPYFISARTTTGKVL